MLGTVLTFLGGLGLFMFGVQTTSDGLQKFAANRMKQILKSLTKRTFLAVLFGTVMTVAFQSSTATTVLVVEFVNAGMMNLAQALGIVLGSAVGTSIAIQLIAFQMLEVALGLIFVGFVLYLVMGARQWKHFGQALIGFGIIFVGMSEMSSASAPLRNVQEVYTFLSQLGTQPLLAIIVGLVLTTIIQSSTAVFGIMMSLAGQHLLPLSATVPLVLGAHIGGTVTTLFSSMTVQKMDARRTAIANTGYKVVGAILVFPFLSQFAEAVEWTTGNLQRQVANAHLLFALFMVVVFLPFNALIAKGLKKILPGNKTADPQLTLKFIDEASLEVPAVALTQAFQEITELGHLIWEKMIKRLPEVIRSSTDQLPFELIRTEKDIDWFYHHISRFLVTLNKKGLADEQSEENMNAQFILKELEYIGDSLASMSTIVQKIHREGLMFGDLEWEKLNELYERVSDNFLTGLQALEHWDQDLAGNVIREHPEIQRVQRMAQFTALAQNPRGDLKVQGVRDDEKIRYATVDLINLFYNVDEHMVNIAQVVMGII